MAVGTVSSFIVGVSNPAMDLLFGRILNTLNESSNFVEEINQLSLYLVIIAGFNFVAGYLQVLIFIFEPTFL